MTKQLIEIIDKSTIEDWVGIEDITIGQLRLDSREVEEGDVFIAIRGHHTDGHHFIAKAIENGARVIVSEERVEDDQVVNIVVENTRKTLGEMTARFYDDPSEEFDLIGITGTNGKTTVATLLFQLMTGMGKKCGLVSTVENLIGDQVSPSTHTTPDNIKLNELLRKMADEGCEYVFMEVSSHAIDQERIAGLKFRGGVFTNISHDHLDYHPTFKDYIWTKKKFFDDLDAESFAMINIDDKRGGVMMQNTDADTKTYALRKMADYKGRIINNEVTGLVLNVNNQEVVFRLVGEFNAYNLLAVYGTAKELGFEDDDIWVKLSKLSGAEGRFERVLVKGNDKIGIVDYAHTPDALENVLQTINKTKDREVQVICIVGCGGDRDKAKRPKMAKIGSRYADRLIITSDNPRTEDPEVILDEMEAGLEKEEKRKMLRITDRRQAIKTAIAIGGDRDIILVAGKGHEKYQDINGVKTPFDDKKVLEAAMLEDI